ncbi:hypothetical protein DF185_19865 [Marinifilum breve]|uniref:Uncharacterized protein n=1 Tax=Marinifilum breve TaxID=2184082 RepID=A0A2V3ZT60_9BACT|nr:hypothetical protein [Marinifilum breve]PXX96899.1 hypothetical protein DF185_19865 [Marinifilum breve]
MAKKNSTPEAKKTEWTIDFDNIKFTTLQGKEIKGDGKFHERLGDILYTNLIGVRGSRLASRIFDGGKVTFDPKERIVLITYLNQDNCPLTSCFVDGLLKELED